MKSSHALLGHPWSATQIDMVRGFLEDRRSLDEVHDWIDGIAASADNRRVMHATVHHLMIDRPETP